MYNVQLPKYISNNYQDLNYLISIYDYLNNLNGKTIVFDFTFVKFIEANICALLGALNESLISRNNFITYTNVNPIIGELLKRNNYFKTGKKDGYWLSPDEETVISYNNFKFDQNEDFIEYIEKDLLGKKYFPKHSDDLEIQMMKCFCELFENAHTHGNCNMIHTCGQLFPNKPKQPLKFSIVNLGKTMKENVSSFLTKRISSTDAIKWALVKYHSTKIGKISGGLGLDVLMNFLNLNNGSMQIISDNGFYELSNNKVDSKLLDVKFGGTIINLMFNIEDKSYYSLDNSMVTVSNPF